MKNRPQTKQTAPKQQARKTHQNLNTQVKQGNLSLQPAGLEPHAWAPDGILQLQHVIGNQAITHLLTKATAKKNDAFRKFTIQRFLDYDDAYNDIGDAWGEAKEKLNSTGGIKDLYEAIESGIDHIITSFEGDEGNFTNMNLDFAELYQAYLQLEKDCTAAIKILDELVKNSGDEKGAKPLLDFKGVIENVKGQIDNGPKSEPALATFYRIRRYEYHDQTLGGIFEQLVKSGVKIDGLAHQAEQLHGPIFLTLADQTDWNAASKTIRIDRQSEAPASYLIMEFSNAVTSNLQQDLEKQVAEMGPVEFVEQGEKHEYQAFKMAQEIIEACEDPELKQNLENWGNEFHITEVKSEDDYVKLMKASGHIASHAVRYMHLMKGQIENEKNQEKQQEAKKSFKAKLEILDKYLYALVKAQQSAPHKENETADTSALIDAMTLQRLIVNELGLRWV